MRARSSFYASGMVGKIGHHRITTVSREKVRAGGQSAEILTTLSVSPADQFLPFPNRRLIGCSCRDRSFAATKPSASTRTSFCQSLQRVTTLKPVTPKGRSQLRITMQQCQGSGGSEICAINSCIAKTTEGNRSTAQAEFAPLNIIVKSLPSLIRNT